MRYDAVKGFWIEHSPGARLDYGFDYSKHLDPGDVITASTWAQEGGLTIDGDTFQPTKTMTWVSGAQPGKQYRIRNTITTAQGRVFVRTMLIIGKIL